MAVCLTVQISNSVEFGVPVGGMRATPKQEFPNNAVGDAVTKLETANQPHQSSTAQPRCDQPAEWLLFAKHHKL